MISQIHKVLPTILRTLFGLVSIASLGTNYCFAASFDVIVPREVNIRVSPGICGVGTPWGWIVATETPISQVELSTNQFTLSTDNSSVKVTTTFYPSWEWLPLQPLDIAGTDVAPFTSRLEEWIHPGENVIPISQNFWRWDIAFSPEFVSHVIDSPGVDEVMLTTKMSIEDKSLTFDTLLRFDSSFGSETNPLEIVSAQRVTAVPEPSTLILASVFAIAVLAKWISSRF